MKPALKKHRAEKEKGHRLIPVSSEQASSLENVGKDGTDKAAEGKKIRKNIPFFIETNICYKSKYKNNMPKPFLLGICHTKSNAGMHFQGLKHIYCF